MRRLLKYSLSRAKYEIMQMKSAKWRRKSERSFCLLSPSWSNISASYFYAHLLYHYNIYHFIPSWEGWEMIKYASNRTQYLIFQGRGVWWSRLLSSGTQALKGTIMGFLTCKCTLEAVKLDLGIEIPKSWCWSLIVHPLYVSRICVVTLTMLAITFFGSASLVVSTVKM